MMVIFRDKDISKHIIPTNHACINVSCFIVHINNNSCTCRKLMS